MVGVECKYDCACVFCTCYNLVETLESFVHLYWNEVTVLAIILLKGNCRGKIDFFLSYHIENKN